MKLTDEQLMDILKEAVKAIALKYNSIVAENKEEVTVKDTVTMEVAPKEIPKKEEVEHTPVETKEEPKTEEVTDVVGEPTNNDPNPPQNTRDILEGMSYNELKVLAKETGVKAIGSKLSLIDKILEAQANSVDPKTDMTTEQIEEAREEDQPKEEDTTEVVEGYIATPKEDVQEEEVFEEEAIEDEEEDNLYMKLVKETMDMSDEEIADLLADVGISPKGRRQALLSKLEQAVRDGLIAFGDDEDEEETVEMPIEEEETVTEDPQQPQDEVEEVEIVGSEERIAKVEELYERYLTEYEEGSISDKDVQDFLKDYYNESNEYQQIVETYTNEEMAEHYALIHAQLVDDEGEEYDWGEPYIVDDEYWCSGQPMKQLDENTLYDEITGEQFSLE